MQQFLDTIFTFPTVPLTVAMGVVLLYWLFVIVGVAGLDLFDGESVAGGVKAAGDAAAGAAKALGGAKAAGGHGGGDHGDHGEGGGLFSLLGLGNIPVTITTSAIVFFAWLGSILVRGLHGGGTLVGSGVLFGCVVASLFVSSVALKPLAKVFQPAKVARRKDIVGHICTISSGKVDGEFGTATISDGGAGLLLNVVCSKANQLKEGDRAVLVEWDEKNGAFEVEPVDWLLPQELDALKDPSTAASVIASRVKAR